MRGRSGKSVELMSVRMKSVKIPGLEKVSC
jgi:hypothetical protein